MKRQNLGFAALLIGLAVFVFPHAALVVDDWHDQQRRARYNAEVARLDAAQLDRALAQAEAPSGLLPAEDDSYFDPFFGGVAEVPSRARTLDSDGVFGWVEIPRIGEHLPVFLGATKAHLAQGVAQISGTSLPAGGVGTHAVVAGHRGYYGKPVFRFLDQLQPGDLITIRAYGRELTYRVSGSEVIRPTQTEKLAVTPGRDELTLLTCTPYLVGTHRLLVHADRLPPQPQIATPTILPKPDIATQGVPTTPDQGAVPVAMLTRFGSYAIALVGLLAAIVIISGWTKTNRRHRPAGPFGQRARES